MFSKYPCQFTEIYQPETRTSLALPLFTCPVSAGFPSPAEDFLEGQLDLNRHLIKNPIATFFVRVTGDSMVGAGIHSGDLLVVDRSLEPRDGQVAIPGFEGELLIQRLRWVITQFAQAVQLQPQNEVAPQAQQLSDLVRRRQQLVERQVAEKTASFVRLHR